MSRPKESIECYEIMHERSISNHDKSISIALKADALVMIGSIDKAILLYKDSLLLTYYQLNIYLPLTECYKEKGNLSSEEWKEFLQQMESAIQIFSDGKNFVSKDVKEDLKKSYLYSEEDTRIDVMRSDIFWAMYMAAEKCKYSSAHYVRAI